MKKYIYKIKHLIITQLLLDALSTGIIAFLPYIQKLLVDIIAKDSDVKYSFSFLIILFLLCIIGYSICTYISSIVTYKGIIGFEVELKRDFFNTVFNYDNEEFLSRDIGEYISIQGNDITEIQQSFMQPSIDLVRSSINLIIYSVILFVYVDWRIAISILVMSIITILIPKITGKELSRKQGAYMKQMGVYVSNIKDLLDGFNLIHRRTINSIENEHEKVLSETANKRFAFGSFKVFSLALYEMSMYLINFTAFIIVGILLFKKEITVGTAVATFGYVGSLLGPLQDILSDINSINSIKETKDKVLKYIKSEKIKSGKIKTTFENEIKLKDVSVTYNNFTLKNISYTFKKNKKYAIIGHSGCGKSTLIKLLSKNIKPKEGDIIIDDDKIESLDLSDILCCVNQKEHIFKEDFYNNVTVFSAYDSKDIKSVLSPFKSNTLDTIMQSKNCDKLSGGEKQLLAVIRMLISKTNICIMDEPFSAMDVNLTKKVQDIILDTEDKTVIMVTHKISNELNSFDEILIMEDGKIVKSGPYNEILSSQEFNKLSDFY